LPGHCQKIKIRRIELRIDVVEAFENVRISIQNHREAMLLRTHLQALINITAQQRRQLFKTGRSEKRLKLKRRGSGVQRFTVAMLKHCTPLHFRGILFGPSAVLDIDKIVPR
jgi:hypothetical protein